MAAGHRGGGRGRRRPGGGGGDQAVAAVRPAEGVVARERCRPGRARQPVGGAGGRGEEKAAASSVREGGAEAPGAAPELGRRGSKRGAEHGRPSAMGWIPIADARNRHPRAVGISDMLV